MGSNRTSILRKRVAQEAAELLYSLQEEEYRQAKLRASKNLGIRMLPSNAEVAVQLDLIAQEKEGKSRKERLVQMRREALEAMKILKDFYPKLVGSVWRGTSHRHSDIDIITYAQEPQEIVTTLRKNKYNMIHSEVHKITKEGEKRSSLHIYVDLPSSNQVEIVVRNLEDVNRREKCEIYGDNITGLTMPQLRKVLKQEAQRKFTP